ncbi:TrkA family potassium uptake protein [Gordonia sp. PDNC005]|uniref:potassium channel family protein n=1 Tax=unclassified Gordonia (in: high G+C Gram-positive bacteria) TaxID=2657482 RepID=UPI00196523D1|nr:TrkA family potassium uptake protein [Gordonia sp. PDNC005]QRY63960.1 TrkA family potassium uptake protein [Gordonia sp. PDNC005]
MRVIIMGCGRVGSALAVAMSGRGHEVVVIDRNSSAFRRLGDDFRGRTVLGVGFDRDVLAEAGIAEADAFAAVSSGDNSNIISARVARETFGVNRVVARIYDAKRAAVYERLGIPTVATVPWTTERFVSALGETAETSVWNDPSGSLAMIVLPFHESWVGVDCQKFQEQTGARIAFLHRLGRPVLPEPRTVIQQDDELYVATPAANVDNARAVAAAEFGE